MSEPIADLSRSLDEAAALILSSSYVVVLAGAAFAEMAGRIAGEVPVPVITPVPWAIQFMVTN